MRSRSTRSTAAPRCAGCATTPTGWRSTSTGSASRPPTASPPRWASRSSPRRASRAAPRPRCAGAAARGPPPRPRAGVVEEAARLLGAGPPLVDQAVTALAGAGLVEVEEIEEAPVYLKPLHAAETGVAARVRSLLAQAPLPLEVDRGRPLAGFEKGERRVLAHEQRQAIRAGLTRKLLVITGGPGTGKTTLVRGLVKILTRKGQRVLLAAPTGRAAKR